MISALRSVEQSSTTIISTSPAKSWSSTDWIAGAMYRSRLKQVTTTEASGMKPPHAGSPMTSVLYITYDGLTDPLGRSQVLPYLTGLAERGHRITVLSCEKPERMD